MKIVITGATGNLGTSTLRALAGDDRVQYLVGLARRRPALEVARTRFVPADITRDDLVPHFEGADAVIHLAWLLQPARRRQRLQRVNVEGSRRVFDAVARAGVPALIHASSVGAYSPGPKHRTVDEGWPTEGIPTSMYSLQKAALERQLDQFERERPEVRVVRMRPGLVFKRGAASEIRRLFIGPLVPRLVFRNGRVPFVPEVDRLRFQCVHSHDVGRAFALAATSSIRGAVNVAADPIVDSQVLSEALGARCLPVPERLLRAGASTAFRLRLAPVHGGWVDLALNVPLMDTSRARSELGWEPRHRATDAVRELLEGLHARAGMPTEPLHAGA